MRQLFVGISDVHVCLKNLNVSLTVLRQALNKARENQVPLMIAGDLNETKAVMRAEWVKALIELFEEFSDVTVHIIDGNHDLNNKAGSKSSLQFLNLMSHVNVYHEPTEIDLSGVPFALIPYCNTKEAFIDAVDKAVSKYMIGHQGIMGAYMGDYVIDESSVPPEILKDFDLVLLGHYHKHQWVGDNIMYFGSPYTVNFGEAGHGKYIWQIYQADGQVLTQPIPTVVRQHRQIVCDNEMLGSYEATHLREDDLIKIIMKGPKEFALQKPNLKHIFPTQQITFSPDIERQSEVRIAQETISKPVQVIKEYLESANTHFDKKTLEIHLWGMVKHIFEDYSNGIRSEVKIHRAIGENFLSYENLDYRYSDSGLTLIEGPTGVGKSSFLDLCCYAMFGKTSKKLKADEVINRKAGKNLFAQVELQTELGTLLITRYRKHDQYENDLCFGYPGEEPIRGKDNLETQKLLNIELGFDYEMFLRSSYFTQFGLMDKFLSASDSEKKNIIAEICGTEIYDEMVEEIKKSIKSYNDEWVALEKENLVLTSRLDTLTIDVENNERLANEWDDKKKVTIQDLENISASWEEQNKYEAEQLRHKFVEWNTRKVENIQRVEENIKKWEKDQEQTKIDLQSAYDDQKALCEEYTAKAVMPEAPNFTEEKFDIGNKMQIIKNLKEEITKISSQIHYKAEKMSELKAKIEQVKTKTDEVNCNHCHQPISKEHIDKHIQEIQLLIDNENREADVLRVKSSEITKSISIESDLEKRLKEIEAIEYEYSVKSKQIEDYKRMADNARAEMQSIQLSLDSSPECPHLESLTYAKNEENPYAGQAEAKAMEKNVYIDQIKAERERQNPHLPLIEGAAKRMGETNTELKELREKVKLLEEGIEIAKWWKDAIHIYIKSYLTDAFIEQLNTLASEILTQKFDGSLLLYMSATKLDRKTTKEKINTVIYNNGEECSYHSLSGGERCRICFALNIAVSQLTGINLGILMIDEVINGLDAAGKSQMMGILKELEAKYGTVFVIDHATEFQSLFTNTIQVSKNNGVSHIECVEL